MNNLEEILYDQFLEREEDLAGPDAAEFENYLDNLDLDNNEKKKLSDLRSAYGETCKKYSYCKGYLHAFQIMKQILLQFFKS